MSDHARVDRLVVGCLHPLRLFVRPLIDLLGHVVVSHLDEPVLRLFVRLLILSGSLELLVEPSNLGLTVQVPREISSLSMSRSRIFAFDPPKRSTPHAKA